MIAQQSEGRKIVRGRRLKHAYQSVFGSMNGKAVLGDLAKRCHAFTTTFSPQSSRVTAFQEGQRSVFLHIQTILNKSEQEIREIAEEDWL